MLLILTLVLSGCSSEGSDDTEPTPQATASSSSAAVAVTVVLGPESVAGWWDGEDWVVAEKGPSEVPVEGGETYTVVRLAAPLVTASGSAAKEGCETNPGSSIVEVPGLERVFGQEEPPPLAVSGVETPRPRDVEILSPASNVYRQAAAEVVKNQGLNDPDVQVVQVVRADMDGDGKDEVIVVAERLTDKQGLFAQAGDYSFVFVRRLVDEVPVTTVVSESIPSTEPDSTPFINSQRVAAIADLNGDGRMELAVSLRYYEGAGMNFYEMERGGTFPEVLRSGCGA